MIIELTSASMMSILVCSPGIGTLPPPPVTTNLSSFTSILAASSPLHMTPWLNHRATPKNRGDVLKGIPMEKAEFLSEIADHSFRYRKLPDDLIINRPTEKFFSDGRYQIDWARSTSYGTYHIRDNTIYIQCPECPISFLNLGNERIFFKKNGKLFMSSPGNTDTVYELLT